MAIGTVSRKVWGASFGPAIAAVVAAGKGLGVGIYEGIFDKKELVKESFKVAMGKTANLTQQAGVSVFYGIRTFFKDGIRALTQEGGLIPVLNKGVTKVGINDITGAVGKMGFLGAGVAGLYLAGAVTCGILGYHAVKRGLQKLDDHSKGYKIGVKDKPWYWWGTMGLGATMLFGSIFSVLPMPGVASIPFAALGTAVLATFLLGGLALIGYGIWGGHVFNYHEKAPPIAYQALNALDESRRLT